MKKILIGGIAGAITFIMASALIFLFMGDYFYANAANSCWREAKDIVMWAGLISALVIGFLLSILFSRSKTTGIISGAKYGAILGLFVMSFMDFTMYAGSLVFNNLSIIMADIVINTCAISITGGVVAWVMGMGKKE